MTALVRVAGRNFPDVSDFQSISKSSRMISQVYVASHYCYEVPGSYYELGLYCEEAFY